LRAVYKIKGVTLNGAARPQRVKRTINVIGRGTSTTSTLIL